MNKRTILLFGAGAAIPWNGPTTSCLTLKKQFQGIEKKEGHDNSPAQAKGSKEQKQAAPKDDWRGFTHRTQVAEKGSRHWLISFDDLPSPDINSDSNYARGWNTLQGTTA